MSEYNAFHLTLSPQQKGNLVSGKSVQLKATDIGVGVPIYLTKTQIKRLEKAKSQSKGARLSLSNAQLQANRGSGIFDSLLDTAANALTGVAKQQLGNAQLALAGMSGNPIYQDVLSFVGKQGQKGAEDLIKHLLSTMQGRGAYAKLKGEGFWDSITDSFESAASSVGDVMKYTPIGMARENAMNSLKEEMGKLASGQVNLADYAKYKGSGFFDDLAGAVSGAVSGVASQAVPALTQAAVGKLLKGKGRGRPRKQMGQGFWNDIGSTLTKTVGTVANQAAPILTQAAIDKILKGKGRPRKTGNGLYLP